MVKNGLPMKLLIAKAIKTIRNSGMPELQPYAERLTNAQKENDMDRVAMILSELATYLQGHRKGVSA